MDRQTFHSFTKWLVDPNESFVMVWLSPPPRPETDPRQNAHSLRTREGNEVQFKRPQRSGAAATRSSLPSVGSRWCHLNGRWAADV